MPTFTCSTCGKTWTENYCPECAHTIDRAWIPPLASAIAKKPSPPSPDHPITAVLRPRPFTPPPIPEYAHIPRPKVVTLYRVWCALILIAYVFFGISELFTLTGKSEPTLGPIDKMIVESDPSQRVHLMAEAREDSIYGLVLALGGIVLFGAGACFCPRKPWAWIWGMVAIIISVFPLCLTIAGAIPLFIFWIK